ncbi:UxaA family hydrolase [Neobacillus cucumis]|uniref:UxaA family hydrolase n=1 Tax=Neobacillus cucumis TaxID=1740721 RepID=UPI0018E0085C|nr:UxaA family hydrolase [Neobacillus cucumis]MBI0579897.1 UxaA family hydrolase [Neobacillus cucumis]
MDKNYKAVMIKPQDNVATALELIPAFAEVTLTCQDKQISVKVQKDIEFGHKFALTLIPKEAKILKYGEVIGRAIEEIEPGAHVHLHNIEGIRGRGDQVGINQ